MIMHGFGYSMSGWGYLFMLLFWVVVIGGIAWVVKAIVSSNTSSRGESPQEILERRFANGDISAEEFKKMKKELRS